MLVVVRGCLNCECGRETITCPVPLSRARARSFGSLRQWLPESRLAKSVDFYIAETFREFIPILLHNTTIAEVIGSIVFIYTVVALRLAQIHISVLCSYFKLLCSGKIQGRFPSKQFGNRSGVTGDFSVEYFPAVQRGNNSDWSISVSDTVSVLFECSWGQVLFSVIIYQFGRTIYGQ